MRIVADTNVLLASIFWNGAPYRVLRTVLDGKHELLITRYILDELERTLTNPKDKFNVDADEAKEMLYTFIAVATKISPEEIQAISRDPKDNPILACAISGRAKAIITRDKDLLVLKEYKGIEMLTPEAFLAKTF